MVIEEKKFLGDWLKSAMTPSESQTICTIDVLTSPHSICDSALAEQGPRDRYCCLETTLYKLNIHSPLLVGREHDRTTSQTAYLFSKESYFQGLEGGSFFLTSIWNANTLLKMLGEHPLELLLSNRWTVVFDQLLKSLSHTWQTKTFRSCLGPQAVHIICLHSDPHHGLSLNWVRTFWICVKWYHKALFEKFRTILTEKHIYN